MVSDKSRILLTLVILQVKQYMVEDKRIKYYNVKKKGKYGNYGG